LRPVIIIGAGRSGTKFLRSVLAASQSCWAIPYDVGFIWRYRNETYPNDALPADLCDERIARFIRKQLVKLARVHDSHAPGILLEKSVPNALRVSFVNAILPDALFLHIIRDGRDVVESAVRQWNKDPELGYLLRKLRYFPLSNVRYAYWYLKNMFGGGQGPRIWGPRYPGIEKDLEKLPLLEICAKQWDSCVNLALADLHKIPSNRCLTLNYENLIKREEVLAEICHFLHLPDPDTVISTYRENILHDRGNQWSQIWSNGEIQQIMDLISPTLSKLGYT
jgi:hypothetical protein